MPSVWPSALVFLLVLAAIPALAWLLRRGTALGPRADSLLRIESAIAVGTRERIAVVRADRKWLVVGITPQAVTLLTELDEPPPPAPGAAARELPPFAGLLRSLSRRHADRP